MNRFGAAVAALLLLAGRAGAGELAAVLSSDNAAYREAYESLTAAYGRPVQRLSLGAPVPRGVDVVVAFGGKAAVQRYPARVTLIYTVAPGVSVDARTHDGATTKIRMSPDPGRLIRKLAEVQSGLKRLGVIWSSEGQESVVEELAAAGRAGGVLLISERMSGDDELPGVLRRLKGKIDGLWLPADPLVINARNFELIKHYSHDNDIPFYVPSEGLAEKGAVAAVSISSAEMGRAAAKAARAALAGDALAETIYAPNVRLTVNLSAARECQSSIPAGVVKAADKVFP